MPGPYPLPQTSPCCLSLLPPQDLCPCYSFTLSRQPSQNERAPFRVLTLFHLPPSIHHGTSCQAIITRICLPSVSPLKLKLQGGRRRDLEPCAWDIIDVQWVSAAVRERSSFRGTALSGGQPQQSPGEAKASVSCALCPQSSTCKGVSGRVIVGRCGQACVGRGEGGERREVGREREAGR